MKTKVVISQACPTCTRAASAPFRVYDARGKVTMGCVDHFHAGHLVACSESSRWHNTPAARKIRAARKTARDGWVTEYAPAGVWNGVTARAQVGGSIGT